MLRKLEDTEGQSVMEEEKQGEVSFPPHCRLLREPDEVEKGGWKEAVISGGDHLKRVLDEYGELNFECLLEELESSHIEGCTACFKTAGERMYRLYVRPKQSA